MRAYFGRLTWQSLLQIAMPWLLAAASPVIHAQEVGTDAGHVVVGYSPYPKQELDQFVAKARAAEALKTPYARCVRADPLTRKTIEAWKAQSPQSAYTLTASGFAYSWAAAQARGSQHIRDTPLSQIREVGRLLTLSNAELEKAARINLDITPIYTTLLDNSTMDDLAGETSSSRRGLVHAPADYDIYMMLMRAAQPRWGGSIEPCMNMILAWGRPSITIWRASAVRQTRAIGSSVCAR